MVSVPYTSPKYRNTGLKMSQVGRAIHAYPSFGFAVQQMASDVAVDALFHGFTGTLVNLLKKT